MKSLTVRLPDELMSGITEESVKRNVSVSDVVRECIAAYKVKRAGSEDTMALVKDLAGSVRGLPKDMSSRTKHYLKKTRYGKRAR
ncbi:MAG: ribbon-helix-helix domain-containing protein [Verrucomicrobia bacterium]|nr:ribbon-helix-helix domain-containing protein [Verrucomicrobiota bacterium]